MPGIIPFTLIAKQIRYKSSPTSVSDLQNLLSSSTINHMPRKFGLWCRLGVVVACLVSYPGIAYAQTSQSNNYKFDESSLNGGGMIQSSSTSYQFGESLSDIGAGNSASNGYQVDAGSNTTSDPSLTFVVNGGSTNFGDFSATTAAVTTSTFTVQNYTSYGYTVQILGGAPANGSHTITPMVATGPSIPGTEQFGINLVANTAPSSVGANPNQGLFGAGEASANYGTANVYRYVSGETIVLAPKSSGTTTFTISYLVNVSSLTPGGQYSAHQVLVCVGTY